MAAPVIHTVGTGKTYATISAATAAAGVVSGDVIEVYAGGVVNVYTENVSFGVKRLYAKGMIPNQGVKIKNSGASNTVYNTGSYFFINNFAIENTAATKTALYGGGGLWAYNCVLIGSGGANGAYHSAGSAGGYFNCLAYGFTSNGFVYGGHCFHCGAFKNTTAGFSGNGGAASAAPLGCLAAGNGTDYLSCVDSPWQWNVSGDLTAPGVGSVTGFNTANCVNYAGNDFRISQAARLTTLARLPGYPLVATDITGRRRPTRERVFFAGPYHCFEQPTWGVGELSGIA